MNEDSATTRYHKVKQHLSENKKVYLVGIGTSAVTAASFLIFQQNLDMKQLLETNPRNSGLLYKSTQIINNTVIQEMVRQGEPGKKTLWVEKGIWFPSRQCAADAAGVSITSVSKVCNGVIDSVKGQHFTDGGDMI